ncbi:MAG: hypothetical protein V9E99_17675 [Microthrixaceae bacterium]
MPMVLVIDGLRLAKECSSTAGSSPSHHSKLRSITVDNDCGRMLTTLKAVGEFATRVGDGLAISDS